MRTTEEIRSAIEERVSPLHCKMEVQGKNLGFRVFSANGDSPIRVLTDSPWTLRSGPGLAFIADAVQGRLILRGHLQRSSK